MGTLPNRLDWFICAEIKSIMYGMDYYKAYLQSKSYIQKPRNILLNDNGGIEIADLLELFEKAKHGIPIQTDLYRWRQYDTE